MHSLVLFTCMLCVLGTSAERSIHDHVTHLVSASSRQPIDETTASDASFDFTSAFIVQTADVPPQQTITGYQAIIASKLNSLYNVWSARDVRFALLNLSSTKADVVEHPSKFRALVVVVAEGGAPERRQPTQPFLSAEPSSPLPTAAINKAASAIESVLRRRLYPFTVKLVTFNKDKNRVSAWAGAFAVFDVSSGEILVDDALKGSWSTEAAQTAIKRVVGPLFDFMAEKAPQLAFAPAGVQHLLQLLQDHWPLLIGAVMVAKVPLWFCALCPAVLGLALPLLINGALGGIAHEVCTHFKMSDEECMEMWYGAFALGFLLSMASAIPIFYVCRLYQCEHPSKAGGAVLSQLTRRLRF